MRVYKLTFRTPGIFLDREVFKGQLYFEIKKNGTWMSVEQAGIQVVPEDRFRLNSVILEPKFTTINVPTRDSQNVTYYMVVQDGAGYEFRIVADQCPDCWDFFQDTDRQDQIIDLENRRGRIIVGQGFIGEQQPYE